MESGQDETKSEEATPKLKVHNLMFRAKLLVLDSADTTGLEAIALEIWPEITHCQSTIKCCVGFEKQQTRNHCVTDNKIFFFPQVRWKSKKSDFTNGGYSQGMLQSLFEKVNNH